MLSTSILDFERANRNTTDTSYFVGEKAQTQKEVVFCHVTQLVSGRIGIQTWITSKILNLLLFSFPEELIDTELDSFQLHESS